MKPIYLIFISLISFMGDLVAQTDTVANKLSFTGDFRFRLEQDWNSRRSDGSFMEDRTRLRYRLRFGARYKYNEWAAFGVHLRTGHTRHQQDPQITLGKGAEEFGTVPVGFERLYFQAQKEWFTVWMGKNTFPFEKQNELFWSDNVYPEGVYMSADLFKGTGMVQSASLRSGHFIINANGGSFGTDSYFQGLQLLTTHWDNRLKIFPSFYYFNQLPNIPDGNEIAFLDYSFFHLGWNLVVLKKPQIKVAMDYYHNFENLEKNEMVVQNLNDQNEGLVAALEFGSLKEKGDWTMRTYYTYLERYSAVDFLAQNDWTRWDYSALGSPAGRLTNFQGLEVMFGYLVDKKFTLKMRYFHVNQIIPYGSTKESGDRIRFDLDIGF